MQEDSIVSLPVDMKTSAGHLSALFANDKTELSPKNLKLPISKGAPEGERVADENGMTSLAPKVQQQRPASQQKSVRIEDVREESKKRRSKRSKQPKRDIDTIHISCYVGNHLPLSMAEPTHKSKERRKAQEKFVTDGDQGSYFARLMQLDRMKFTDPRIETMRTRAQSYDPSLTPLLDGVTSANAEKQLRPRSRQFDLNSSVRSNGAEFFGALNNPNEQISLIDEGTTFGDRFEASERIQAAEVPGLRNSQVAMFQGRQSDGSFLDARPGYSSQAAFLQMRTVKDRLDIRNVARMQAKEIVASRSSSRQGPPSRGSSQPAGSSRPVSRQAAGPFGGRLGLSASQVGAMRRDFITAASQRAADRFEQAGFAPDESAITHVLEDGAFYEDQDDSIFNELDLVSKLNPNPIHRMLSPSGQKQFMRRQKSASWNQGRY